jgi:ADP-dependent NAD(P)H-hydrate dehydratase / NAD(P)H-hydrate epimerase
VKIFTSEQIRAWDAYTIKHEPIASIDLMERAAGKCTDWLLLNIPDKYHFKIFCGKGNNGGDGLVIARLLHQNKKTVDVYVLEFGKPGTDDFQTNLQRLHELLVPIHFLQSPEMFPTINSNNIIIDALFGTGLNKPLDGLSSSLVQHINSSSKQTVSIDVPSGLFTDRSSKGNTVVRATNTLTFQAYKKAFLIQENAEYIGIINVLDIGLDEKFLKETVTSEHLLDKETIVQIFQPRKPFAHKGTYGHALIAGGSYGKIGAAQLAVNACLHSGAGLVTAFVPRCGYTVLQTSMPEAMVMTDEDESMITSLPSELEKYAAVGIGLGMGTNKLTRNALIDLIKSSPKKLVIDADGLNSIALQPEVLSFLPPNTILTPHPKEFERLFGACENDFERIEKARLKATEHNIIIVLKGHHTAIALPDSSLYFNSTGNAGMAKGGSGDVLTGIITALCAQPYTPVQAVLFGVYLHGLAGDYAAAELSQEAMTATDLIKFLSNAFLQLNEEHRQLLH